MQQMIPVNILVGDRTYRVLVEPADEERIRRLAKAVNEQLLDFKTRFAGKDMQDYLAMVLLWHLSEPKAVPAGGADLLAVSEELSALESMLDGAVRPSPGEG